MGQFSLTGECNRCGRCCEPVVDGRRMRCEHLRVDSFVGLPGATVCAVYAHRVHMMAIRLYDVGDPRFSMDAACGGPGTDEETRAIIVHGIGRGCSLQGAENGS